MDPFVTAEPAGRVLHAEELQGWHRNWRDLYRFMQAIPWPGFLISLGSS
jgi:hypothetical protein